MKNLAYVLVVVAVIVGALYFFFVRTQADPEVPGQATALVEQFGRQLQYVSLTTNEEAVAAAIDEYYGQFVDEELLEEWKESPTEAPGRLTSSPWPDRIVVHETVWERGGYTVRGSLIEVTSETEAGQAPPQSYVIEARVEREDGAWRITEFTGGPAR